MKIQVEIEDKILRLAESQLLMSFDNDTETEKNIERGVEVCKNEIVNVDLKVLDKEDSMPMQLALALLALSSVADAIGKEAGKQEEKKGSEQ